MFEVTVHWQLVIVFVPQYYCIKVKTESYFFSQTLRESGLWERDDIIDR